MAPGPAPAPPPLANRGPLPWLTAPLPVHGAAQHRRWGERARAGPALRGPGPLPAHHSRHPRGTLQESPGSTADAFSAVQTHFSLDGVPCAQRLLGPRARPACPVSGILRPLTGPSPPLRTPFWRPFRAQDPNPAWQPQFSASREGTRPYGATRVFSLQLYPSELSASKSPERRQEPPRS